MATTRCQYCGGWAYSPGGISPSEAAPPLPLEADPSSEADLPHFGDKPHCRWTDASENITFRCVDKLTCLLLRTQASGTFDISLVAAGVSELWKTLIR